LHLFDEREGNLACTDGAGEVLKFRTTGLLVRNRKADFVVEKRKAISEI
jgi:hypothetical protein